jgi:SAM-dependent methyltransferase
MQLPYFDFLLERLARGDPAIGASFGRHVHWGYWARPREAACDDADFGRAAEALTLEMCELARVADGMCVLDAGCGFGGTLALLNERFGGMQLAGLNIDARQLARAQRQVAARDGNRVALLQGDACRLPFADASLDRVLAVEAIFHFPSREAFFGEACRVLKRGGILVLSDFVPSPLLLPGAALAAMPWFGRLSEFGHCDIRYTLGRYRRLAAATGLVPHGERNVTANTLPTYRYLRRLARDPAASPWRDPTAILIGLLEALGRTRLLSYCLLGFRKP